jgi:Tol biopolymer transport system component
MALLSHRIFWLLASLTLLTSGCAEPEFNRTPTRTETDSLFSTVQLTSDFDKAGEAYFSHDMNWIIFQAVPHGEKQYQMFVAPFQHGDNNVNMGEPIRISPPNSRNTCGFFSPDGNSLIFASTAGKENPDEPTSGYQRAGRDYRWSFPAGIEIFRADGWPAALAAHEPGKPLDLAVHPLTNNDAYDAECAYSPDGRSICFTSNRTGDLDVYIMRADGSHVLQITKNPGYDGGPFFSPDGKHLVYRSDRKGDNLLQIFVADLAFAPNGDITGITAERQLTHDVNVNWGPYWHPDGQHIVYATSLIAHTNYELYLMRADGSHKTRITFSAGFDGLPVFSADGNYLMWTSTRSANRTSQIFIARFHMPPGM